MNATPTEGVSPFGRTFVMPAPGDIVAGKYAIVRVLGEGGMGIVYEATHQRLRQRVALKMLLPAMLEHEVIVSRFEREARAAAQLRGRHCARVNDVDVTPEGLPYMVMDFLEGHDLEVELQRRGPLPVPEAVDYVLQACAAMVEAHQLGIVHRDLKPSNLFLEHETDGGYVVKVLDFGISKVAATEGDAKLTEADTVMGTALYMSPEQVRASHAVDARSDIWSLGVILYEALSGRVPWLGPPPQVAALIVTEDPPDLRTLPGVEGRVPEGLTAIVHKTLQRDPANRFTDVKQLAMALAPFGAPGSAGRSFAEAIVGSGSSAQIVLSLPPESGNSLTPRGARTELSAPTLLNAPGVAQDRMTPESATAPGWQPPKEATRGRAVLLGMLVAVAAAVVSIGAVVLFVRKPHATVVTVTEPSVSPSPPKSVAPIPLEMPPASASTPASPASAPSTTGSVPVSSTKPARPVVTGNKPTAPPPSPPVVKPAASVQDKPLFL